MAENAGDGESEFDSVTSSQKSFLNNCSFADPDSLRQALPTKSSDGVVETESDRTEVLENPISPPITRTPVLSFSSPTSFDSINDDDVFRTPPENASLSSATADSEPRLRFSKMKPKPDSTRGSSKSKSPSSEIETTTPLSSSSPSLPAENVRVLETNRFSDSVETVKMLTPLSSPLSVSAGNVTVPAKNSDLNSPSPMSVEDDDVRATGKHSDLDSQSPAAIGRTRVSENQPISDFVSNTGAPKSPSPAIVPVKQLNPGSSSGIKITEKEDPETAIPFKEIFEALLRNSGENLHERDEKVSYIDILKQCGLKFPK
uniref:Uncharacterized protein n=1 Tax=Noccaea caerulescens TaxID=107243 RepID=A0A1J3FE57_NOCCA